MSTRINNIIDEPSLNRGSIGLSYGATITVDELGNVQLGEMNDSDEAEMDAFDDIVLSIRNLDQSPDLDLAAQGGGARQVVGWCWYTFLGHFLLIMLLCLTVSVFIKSSAVSRIKHCFFESHKVLSRYSANKDGVIESDYERDVSAKLRISCNKFAFGYFEVILASFWDVVPHIWIVLGGLVTGRLAVVPVRELVFLKGELLWIMLPVCMFFTIPFISSYIDYWRVKQLCHTVIASGKE